MKTPNLERASQAKVLAWQWRQVKALLHRASATPFYKQLFAKKKIKIESIKNWQDFFRLPLTYEDDLRDRAQDFFYPRARVWRVFATSGTTGKPKLIWRQPIKKDSAVVFLWRQLLGRLNYWPQMAAIMRPAGGLGASGPTAARVFEHLNIPVFTASPEADLSATAQAFLEIKPDTLLISPSFALLLFYHLKSQGVNLSRLGVKIIISTGEALRVNERIWLEKELGASVFNTYGAADPSVWLASECQARQGLHIFPYTAYLEIVNNKLVVTPFANSAMALVRYVLGDKIKLDYQKCACGRTLPRIVSVEREAKPLIVGNKKITPAIALPKILAGFRQVTSFFNFVYEPDKSLINIIIESDKDILATNKKRVLTRAIKKACLEQWPQLADLQTKGVKIKISLVPIGTLPRRAAKLVDQARIKRY